MRLEPELWRALEREMDPGETTLWSGQPGARRVWLQSLPVMLFAIPWTAFAVFWMAMAAQGSVWFALFGVPFVAVGVFMLTTPVWAGRAARRTVYAITDRRALIIEGGWPRKTRSYIASTLSDIERVERPDGSGDLLLGPAPTFSSGSSSQTRRPGFYGLPNVRAVERQLLDMLARHGRASIEEVV